MMPQQVVCPSVCPSVTLRYAHYADHIGWNTSKIVQREHHEILAGIGVGYGKSGSRHTNCNL